MVRGLFYILISIFLPFTLKAVATPVYTSPQDLCRKLGETTVNGELINSINDVSYLNNTPLSCIVTPESINEISNIVRWVNNWNKTHQKIHISVSGTKHSQGGHIASKLGITLNMKHLNSVQKPVLSNGLWKVQVEAGALWSDVHNAIKKNNDTSLANKVQQSSTPFTVGGSLSVNAHGRSFSYGSIFNSVEKITLVLPSGKITSASRTENPLLFKQAIGGYGLFGVIVKATLELNINHYLKPKSTKFNTLDEYITSLKKTIIETPTHKLKRNHTGQITSLTNSKIAFLFATLSLEKDGFLSQGTAYTYYELPSIDFTGAVNQDPNPSLFNFKALVTKIGFWLKRKGLIVSIAQQAQHRFLMEQDTHLKVLTPPIKPILAASSDTNPDLLQEYFIPVNNMPDFIKYLKEVFGDNKTILSNAALRFIPKSEESPHLNYESKNHDQLAVVLYFSMKPTIENIQKAEKWTQNIVEKALSLNGRYYLPYQQWPSVNQFQQAYPNYKSFKKAKIKNDPNTVFSNRFFEHYFK